MRIFIPLIAIITLGLVIYNLTLINYSNPLNDDSITAVITTACGLCALLILAILYVSKKIDRTLKKKS